MSVLCIASAKADEKITVLVGTKSVTDAEVSVIPYHHGLRGTSESNFMPIDKNLVSVPPSPEIRG